MDKVIELNFNRKDIEEILLANNAGSYFKSEKTKDSFPSMLFFSALLTLLAIVDWMGEVYLFFYVTVVPFWIYNTISYWVSAKEIHTYKSGITKWLDHIASYTSHSIELTENSISVIMDDEKTIQTWKSIKACKINEQRMVLQGEEQFYIPSKAMTREEYALLKEFVEKKIKSEEEQ